MQTFRGLVLAASMAGAAGAQRVGAPTDELDKLSVEELFQVQVTSVGRCVASENKPPIAAPV